jgi:hypothetical protein
MPTHKEVPDFGTAGGDRMMASHRPAAEDGFCMRV